MMQLDDYVDEVWGVRLNLQVMSPTSYRAAPPGGNSNSVLEQTVGFAPLVKPADDFGPATAWNRIYKGVSPLV
jgi:hypothetical protein